MLMQLIQQSKNLSTVHNKLLFLPVASCLNVLNLWDHVKLVKYWQLEGRKLYNDVYVNLHLTSLRLMYNTQCGNLLLASNFKLDEIQKERSNAHWFYSGFNNNEVKK